METKITAKMNADGSVDFNIPSFLVQILRIICPYASLIPAPIGTILGLICAAIPPALKDAPLIKVEGDHPCGCQ